MNSNKSTRELIVESADRLFYQRGFEFTSFADISDEVKISRGNFYHHFKSKDEILEAVIELRLSRAQKLLDAWESETPSPGEQIKGFTKMLVTNKEHLKLYGCPVGTLCTELTKMDHASKKQATKIMTLYREWLGRQFSAAGRKKDADQLAMHVLARSQGIATLANTFDDDRFFKHEIRSLEEWISSQIK